MTHVMANNFKNYTLETCPLFSLNGLKIYARLVDIIDGDSMKVILPIFGEHYFRFNVRLDGIDTSELKSKDETNKERGLVARNTVFEVLTNTKIQETDTRTYIKEFLNTNIILVWIECLDFDKYGRLLANVFKVTNPLGVLDTFDTLVIDQQSISEYLLNHNLAYSYKGKTKLTEHEQNEELL